MIGMIWAQAHNRAIGENGTVPWHVPEDMAMFRTVTAGSAVVMGRATWESIEPAYRPLAGRYNYVVTTQDAFTADGATVVHSLEDAITLAEGDDPERMIWVIGGARVYEQLMDRADGLVVTDLDLEVPEATAHAPHISFDWQIINAEPERGWLRSSSGINYRFTEYARKGSRFPVIDLSSAPHSSHDATL
ncbi:MAG: dihydrofolate reductase [Actinomycetaceae bacterium]|nr:dihydrofolate reductase [Arcanobacterium sp.]MDD7505628.1 dihydrofolate reductase [Actinomycetaceae bacterium]MDY6143406.1 dihydrofolate reductase [Arcanobacterium sp.]